MSTGNHTDIWNHACEFCVLYLIFSNFNEHLSFSEVILLLLSIRQLHY